MKSDNFLPEYTKDHREKAKRSFEVIVEENIKRLVVPRIKIATVVFKLLSSNKVALKELKKYGVDFRTKKEQKCKIETETNKIKDSYFKKFGDEEKLYEIIFKATYGRVKEIKSLISYDKTWIYDEDIKCNILKKFDKDDQNFFEFLSGAFKIQKKSRLRAKSQVHAEVYDFLRFMLNEDLFVLSGASGSLDNLFEFFNTSIVSNNVLGLNKRELEMLADFNLLYSKDYFKYYVRKNKLYDWEEKLDN